MVLSENFQMFVQTKTEKLKSQQREYEAQLQYRQHLQVPPHASECNIHTLYIRMYTMRIRTFTATGVIGIIVNFNKYWTPLRECKNPKF